METTKIEQIFITSEKFVAPTNRRPEAGACVIDIYDGKRLMKLQIYAAVKFLFTVLTNARK